jgi:hypothetical protein
VSENREVVEVGIMGLALQRDEAALPLRADP